MRVQASQIGEGPGVTPDRPVASAPAAPADGSADLRELIGILHRNLRLIGLTTALTTSLAIGYLAIAPSLYNATVSILIDARGRAPVGTDPASIMQVSPDTTLVESQVKMFTADTVLRRAVLAENLAEDPDFGAGKPGLRASLMAALGLGSRETAPADNVSRAVTALARGVTVKRSERTYVIDVDVTSSSPQKAARLANAIADAYLADQQAAKGELAQRDSRWLNQRVAELQARVQEAEARVAQYKRDNRITDANGKNVGEQELSDLATELAKARTRTSDAKARHEQVLRIVASGRAPDAVGDAFKSTALDKLRAQYADITRQEANLRTTLGVRHPAWLEVQTQLGDTRRLITEELRRIGEGAANEYQVARANETEILHRLDLARQASDGTNQAIVRLRELERDADANRTVYEKFLRTKESGSENTGDNLFARVIAPALPPVAASSPKSAAVLAIAVFGGLFLGAGTALFRDYMNMPDLGGLEAQPADPRSRGGRNALRIPDIGEADEEPSPWPARLLRRATRRRRKVVPTSTLDEILINPQSPFSLAIASLYDELIASGARRRATPWTLLVTSAIPGAGKTVVAVNLARYAASRGKRTLLIDANRDHPALSALVRPRKRPGLIEFAQHSRPVYPVDGADGFLHVIPILEFEQTLVERLGRDQNTRTFEGVAGNFDVVILDAMSAENLDDLRDLAETADRILVVGDASNVTRDALTDLTNDLDIPPERVAHAITEDEAGRAA